MISIIIPVYNSEDYLYTCLNSILKQTYQNFEVICFNNNSTDSSKDILEYFTLKDSRIKIITNEKNKDELYCKNKSLAFAQGKYITFLNSEKWIPSQALEILIKHAKENNLDLIYYNNKNVDLEEFEIFNIAELDEEKIEILNKTCDKFYSKSILKNNDLTKIEYITNRISLINKLDGSNYNIKNENEIFDKIKIKQQLTQIKNQINKIEYFYKNQQNQTKQIMESQMNLNNFAKVFMDNYHESRKNFFNNQEDKLKKYFDTNELFRICYFNNFKFISYSPAENRILIKTDDGLIIGSNNRFYTIKEVIGFDGYSIPQLYDFDEFIVFDVGMNRAYASLWFAKFNNCKHVYGFEIDPDTYNKAISNINLNSHLSNKITPFNFGLSNENEIVDLYYVNGCDGVNTMLTEVVDLQPELQDKNKLLTKKVKVKKASETLSTIIKNEKISSKIVLKIDTEGAEYNILEDLIESKVITKIDVLLGEGHIFEREHFCDKLNELGFKQIELQINPVNYSFSFVKEDYFKIWPLKE